MNKINNKYSFIGHLEILRWHLLRSVIASMICSMIVFFNKSIVFDKIIFACKENDFPTYVLLCKISDNFCIKDMPFILMNIDLSGQFLMHLLVSFVGGIILAFPYILFEFWRFISPALYRSEKTTSIFLFLTSFLLFTLGVTFGYYVIVPFSINFLSTYAVSGSIENNIHFISFIKTIVTVVITSGILFQLPLIIYALTKFGLITADKLRQYRRHSFVIILILASILTPPDIFSQILIGLPIFLLYEISVIISSISIKKYDSSSK